MMLELSCGFLLLIPSVAVPLPIPCRAVLYIHLPGPQDTLSYLSHTPADNHRRIVATLVHVAPLNTLPCSLMPTFTCDVPHHAGYKGGVIATCLGNNTWSAGKGSCYKSTTSCYGPPSGSPGPNSSPWPFYPPNAEFNEGDEIEARCISTDYVGKYHVLCSRWVRWIAAVAATRHQESTCMSQTAPAVCCSCFASTFLNMTIYCV